MDPRDLEHFVGGLRTLELSNDLMRHLSHRSKTNTQHGPQVVCEYFFFESLPGAEHRSGIGERHLWAGTY